MPVDNITKEAATQSCPLLRERLVSIFAMISKTVFYDTIRSRNVNTSYTSKVFVLLVDIIIILCIFATLYGVIFLFKRVYKKSVNFADFHRKTYRRLVLTHFSTCVSIFFLLINEHIGCARLLS